jgi:Tol biopolymer transport system component
MRHNKASAFGQSICVFLLLTLWQSQVSGATLYDPSWRWHTLQSPRFTVNYTDGQRNLAIRVSRIAESVLDDVSDVFGYTPGGKIDIVMSDNSDAANGSAQVAPKNTVRIFLSAPTELAGLSYYDDWLRLLLIHELGHICDIDQTWGFNRLARWLLGKYIAPNGTVPQFLSEGAGVYVETVLSQAGRGRSSYVAMLLRMAALEGTFLDIDQGHVMYADWPGGNAAYFYGGMFHLWLEKKYGREKVRKLHHHIAATPIPYVYWPAAKLVFGKSLPDLWQQWKKEEVASALALSENLQKEGLTASRRITFHGRNITGVRYSPDGASIVYSRTSPVDGSTVRQVQRDGSSDHHLVLQTLSTRTAFSKDGNKVFYAQSAINERFNDFNDLYVLDRRTQHIEKLHDAEHPQESLRGRDPDISPDGMSVVFVRNQLHQNAVVKGTWVKGSEKALTLQVLVDFAGDVQHASPQFSPDGKWIALSSWLEGGKRDIVIIDAQDGHVVHRVTSDKAMDGNPTWTPDGAYLLYESDVDGISNVYAYALQSKQYYRVTRVLGGAYQPDVSPDGAWILFRNASGVGFDIHEMPCKPDTWEPVFYNPSKGYGKEAWAYTAEDDKAMAEGYPNPLPRDQEPALVLKDSEKEGRYWAWKTLLPMPHQWMLAPSMMFLNDDFRFDIATFGQDVLARHAYAASIGTSWYTQRPNWFVQYTNDQWYPTFSVGVSDNATSLPSGSGLRLNEIRRSAGASMLLPLRQRHVISSSYFIEDRTLQATHSSDVAFSGLSAGRFARVEVGYRYRFTRRFPYSVSDEHGSSLGVAARMYSSVLGGQFNEFLMMLDGRAYVNNPLFNNHVLAMRFASALALGPEYKERFVLGGSQGNSIVSVQADRQYPLRGFPLDLKRYPAGAGLFAGYLEYRFPLAQIQKGLWTLPVFLQRFHAAVFLEGGNTFGTGQAEPLKRMFKDAWHRVRTLRASYGAELRADILLSWAAPLTLRLGLGLPLLDEGMWQSPQNRSPVMYFAFGSSL